jgi:hypothetical protein
VKSGRRTNTFCGGSVTPHAYISLFPASLLLTNITTTTTCLVHSTRAATKYLGFTGI